MGDAFRFLILILGSLVGPAMTVVLVLHFRAWKALRTVCRESGLLPLHVACVSASYGILTYGLMAGMVQTLGDPFNFRLVFFAVGLLLGLASLVIIGSRQKNRRLTFQRQETTVKIEEGSQTLVED